MDKAEQRAPSAHEPKLGGGDVAPAQVGMLGVALADLEAAGKILRPSPIEGDLDDLGLARLCVYDLADEARILLERESAPEHLRIAFIDGAWRAWDAEYPEHGTVELRPRHRAIALLDPPATRPPDYDREPGCDCPRSELEIGGRGHLVGCERSAK